MSAGVKSEMLTKSECALVKGIHTKTPCKLGSQQTQKVISVRLYNYREPNDDHGVAIFAPNANDPNSSLHKTVLRVPWDCHILSDN